MAMMLEVPSVQNKQQILNEMKAHKSTVPGAHKITTLRPAQASLQYKLLIGACASFALGPAPLCSEQATNHPPSWPSPPAANISVTICK